MKIDIFKKYEDVSPRPFYTVSFRYVHPSGYEYCYVADPIFSDKNLEQEIIKNRTLFIEKLNDMLGLKK